VGDEGIPEDPPDHGSVLRGPFLGRGQAVEARRQDGVDGARDLDLLHRPGQFPAAIAEAKHAAVHEHPDELLREERVAIGERHHPLAQLGRQAAGEEGVDELGAFCRVERLEHDRRGIGHAATPGRAKLEELVAGEAEQDDRPVGPAGHVLDEIEQALVGPMDVLLDKD
jgi:hypothetical protein